MTFDELKEKAHAYSQKRRRFWGPGGRLHILGANELPRRQGFGQSPKHLCAPDGAARCRSRGRLS